MRQRITFLQRPEDAYDPSQLQLTQTSILAKNLRGARQERVTFSFESLPQELYRVLKSSYEIHIRWASPNPYETIPPIVSRVSPGLHIFYTPQQNTTNSSKLRFYRDLLCSLIKKIFGTVDCESFDQSFTALPTDRFSLSAANQYFQPLESLDDLVDYLRHKLCDRSDKYCLSRVENLLQADSVDIDFDAISHALTLTAFWSPRIWDLDLRKLQNNRLEVGILSAEKPQEIEELSLGGFLTVVGEDHKPSPTLFSFPARHHSSPSTFSASFLQPTGLHPTLELQISSSKIPNEEQTCSLLTYLTLPRTIFADKYQLSDHLFMASKNLTAIHHISSPVDLEAPEYAMKLWGSSMLLELAPPKRYSDDAWTAQIPLHLRYLVPTFNTTGQSPIDVPYPAVFWACVADEGSKFPINPFDRVNLGYDGLFGPKTMFYHLSPTADGDAGRLLNTISVPVLDLDKSKSVEIGTTVVILLGFAWILWRLVQVWQRDGYGSGSTKGKDNLKKKTN
ncbi:PIG-X [Xylogone sp. PMI_703]|nr:PIG-X [Xylogone sp. PMI_703]